MIQLTEGVRMVLVQFQCNGHKGVPAYITRLDEKSSASRGYTGKGVQVIKPTQNVSLDELCTGLKASGLELVSAFCQDRPVDGHSRYIVRFTFVRASDVKDPAEVYKWQNLMRTALSEMCETALWQTTAFVNPYFRDSEAVEGLSTASINCNMRTPLYCSDRTPKMRWQKDDNGRRIGDAPLPLRADYLLVVRENTIGLTI